MTDAQIRKIEEKQRPQQCGRGQASFLRWAREEPGASPEIREKLGGGADREEARPHRWWQMELMKMKRKRRCVNMRFRRRSMKRLRRLSEERAENVEVEVRLKGVRASGSLKSQMTLYFKISSTF